LLNTILVKKYDYREIKKGIKLTKYKTWRV